MFYVIAQFVLLSAIAWPVANLQFSIVGLGLIFIAVVISFGALIANRPGNFNVRPIPKVTGELITDGIYHYIRHPMYSSLFFGGLGVVFCQPVWWKIVAWFLLIGALMLKARFEEKALCEHYPAYKMYQQTNKSFIPFIW